MILTSNDQNIIAKDELLNILYALVKISCTTSCHPFSWIGWHKCYKLTPLVPFRTADWDCRLIYYTRVMTHKDCPTSLSRGLMPWNSVLSRPMLLPRPVYCLTPCYCLAPCTVSPRAIASPRVLSHPVDCLALCHCLVLCYCLAPTILTTIKTCIYASRSLKLLLKSIS